MEYAGDAESITLMVKVNMVLADRTKASIRSIHLRCGFCLQIFVAVQILWPTTLCLTKLSMLLLYTNIFVLPSFVLAARITAIFVVGYNLATVLATLLICQPLSMSWGEVPASGGHCGDQIASYLSTGILNIVTDVIVVLLPVPYLGELPSE